MTPIVQQVRRSKGKKKKQESDRKIEMNERV